jgi:hypothetical protein
MTADISLWQTIAFGGLTRLRRSGSREVSASPTIRPEF